MADQVLDIKSRIDLAQLIGERVALKQRGNRFIGLCPFHSEKTPSFTVSPELGIFKCFGCGVGGDAFTFLERYEGMTFLEALEFTAERVGVKLERRVIDRETRDIEQKLYEVNHLASEYFHFLLVSHKVGEKARSYLEKRGIRKTTIEHFFLGYALDRWDGLLTFLVKKGYEPELLEQAGLVIRKDEGRGTRDEGKTKINSLQPSSFNLRPSHFYDRFRGRVIFPLRDVRGQVVGFAGRVLDPETKEAKYINSSETPVYHKGRHLYGIFENREEVRKSDRAILVEGEFDALGSWQSGVKQVLAVKGTALTEDQLKLVRRYTRQVTLAMDADEAGWTALVRSLPNFEKLGMNVRVATLPKGAKDPDELAKKNPDAWRDLVDHATGVYDAFITGVIDRVGIETGAQKKQISEEIIPVLAGIGNAVEQDHWIKEVAGRLHVREDAIRKEITVFLATGSTTTFRPNPSAADTEKVEHRSHVLGKYLVALLVQGQLAIPESLSLEWVEPVGVRTIVKRIAAVKKFDSQKAIRNFRDELPQELRDLFDEASLMPLTSQDHATEGEGFYTQELEQTLTSLEREWIKKELVTARSDPDRVVAFSARLGALPES